MSRDRLLHYLITCIEENCEIKRVHTPGAIFCLVEVKPYCFFLDGNDVRTLEELENSANWMVKSALYMQVRNCLRPKKEVKDE